MKYLSSLLLFAIFCHSGNSICSTWTDRMKKYGDLVRCQYYVTSETDYNYFIPYHNNESETTDEHWIKLKFSTLARKAIKIKFMSNRTSDAPATDMPAQAQNPYNGYDDYRYGMTAPPITEPPLYKSKSETHTFDVGYEIVISSVESRIETDTKRIRTLSTPDIIRESEPNEVLIEIFKDGQVKVAVNNIEALLAHIELAERIEYFSFASSVNGQRDEFFYFCQ